MHSRNKIQRDVILLLLIRIETTTGVLLHHFSIKLIGAAEALRNNCTFQLTFGKTKFSAISNTFTDQKHLLAATYTSKCQ